MVVDMGYRLCAVQINGNFFKGKVFSEWERKYLVTDCPATKAGGNIATEKASIRSGYENIFRAAVVDATDKGVPPFDILYLVEKEVIPFLIHTANLKL